MKDILSHAISDVRLPIPYLF